MYFVVNPIKPLLVKSQKKNCIVSLTTFPSRIDNVWMTLESMLYQTEKPDKILLWLYHGEFPVKDQLPKKLLALEKRGVEICFCQENLMPHKKYYYSMKRFPNSDVITIDDDVIYPPNLIATFKQASGKFQGCILSTVARKIRINGHKVSAYENWNIIQNNTNPKKDLLPIGAGGVYYPANSIHSSAFNKKDIQDLALKTDDLWLKVMSMINGTRIVVLAGVFNYSFIPVIHKDKAKLMGDNVQGGGNNSVFKTLLEKYDMNGKSFLD